MRGISLLRALVVCVAALGPFSPILRNAVLWLSWTDFGSANRAGYYWVSFGFRRPARFIWMCAFLCLSMAAQAQAVLTDLRQGVLR